MALVAPAAFGPAPAAAAELTVERLFSDPALSGPQARGVRVSPAGDRVTFLRGRDDDQFQLDLWQIELGGAAIPRLLVDSRRLVAEEHLSDEEKARRERERTAAYHGIVEYSWSPDGRSLLVPLGGDLYLVDLSAPGAPQVRKLALQHKNVIDPKISPRGRYVSFVHEQNLYVLDLQTGAERALTTDGRGPVHNGESEFVAQEEFNQSSGYWWSPDDTHIAFKQFDESAVTQARRVEAYADRLEMVEQRYPAAGEANAAVKLGLLSPEGKGAPRWLELGSPTANYLVRVNWLPDGRRVAVQRLARDQKTLDLLFVDAATLRPQTVLTETSRTWIEVHDDLRFFADGTRFLWASERSGYKHLYLYGIDGTQQGALTAGDWSVDEVLALDEAGGRVVFAANKDRIEDSQIYTAALAPGGGAPQRLSQADGWHAAAFGCSQELLFGCKVQLYVDTWSDAQTPPQVSVRSAQGQFVAWIEQNRLDDQHPYGPYRAQHVAAEFGALPAPDGQALHYRLLKPAGLVAGQRYPVLLSFYGGPTAQVAMNAWERNLFDQYLAQHGIGVFTLDNRGTSRRGRAFSDVIYGRLGTVEVADQMAGLHWLAGQAWVDAAHIGCFGWSYGGYLSLMLLARSGGEIAAGVSVAPVTDWRIYDTAYVERYLGMPQANPEGYRDSSVFTWLPGLKSPLLLAHGMADDNVLFTNSTRLMAALQGQGTLFSLMTYPGGKHGLSTPTMQKHVFRTIARFLQEHLQAGAMTRTDK
jgi:dipeptidyl-peptidase-4